MNKMKLIALTLLLLVSACNRSKLQDQDQDQDQQVVALDETMTVQKDKKVTKTGSVAAFDSTGENMGQTSTKLINHSSIADAQPIDRLTTF